MVRGIQGLIGTIAAGLIIAAGPLAATTVTSTGYSAWKTNVTGAATEVDVSGPTGSFNTASGVTFGGFNFVGLDGSGGYSLTNGYQSFGGNNIQALAGGSGSGAVINVGTPTGGENALLLAVGSSTGAPLTLTLSDGESFTMSTQYFGISLSHDITSFSLSTTSGSQAYLFSAIYGASSLPQDPPTGGGGGGTDPAQTPECATLFMLGGGLLVVFGSRRKLASNFSF